MASPSSNQASASVMLTLTNSAYDRDKVYSNATDSKGHGERERVRLPPPIQAELHALVQSGVQPEYRTVEDYIRNAVVHQLHYDMNKIWPQANRVLTAERTQAILTQFQALVATWTATLRMLEETGEQLLASNALEELAEMLSTFDSQYSETNMPDVVQLRYDDIIDNLNDRLTRARRKQTTKGDGEE